MKLALCVQDELNTHSPQAWPPDEFYACQRIELFVALLKAGAHQNIVMDVLRCHGTQLRCHGTQQSLFPATEAWAQWVLAVPWCLA